MRNTSEIDSFDTRSEGDATGRAGEVLVLVGDAQHARLVRASPGGGALEIVWETFAPTRDMHALGQTPDVSRKSGDSPHSTRAVRQVDWAAEFARDVAEQVGGILHERAGQRLVVIAPRSFADALEAALGGAWPSRRGDVVYRDEIRLDDEALRRVIDATLGRKPNA
jgi:hypothetical protein